MKCFSSFIFLTVLWSLKYEVAAETFSVKYINQTFDQLPDLKERALFYDGHDSIYFFGGNNNTLYFL